MKINDLEENIPCIECQSGKMHSRMVTYITWIGDDMITVPDFPAWTCDFCGRSIYDSKALKNLSLLLNSDADSPEQNMSKTIRKEINNFDSISRQFK